jgi:hypothetical protein
VPVEVVPASEEAPAPVETSSLLHEAPVWPLPTRTTPDVAPAEPSLEAAPAPVVVEDLQTASAHAYSQLLDPSGVGVLAAVLGGVVALALGIGTSVWVVRRRN